MKPPVVALLVALASAVASLAQPFEVQTTFLGAPAGVSRNGAFTVSGVVGQPEAGMVAGGGFTSEGGWPAPMIVESPGAPTLLIGLDRASGAVTVAWPATATGHSLEATADVNDPEGWTDVSTIPVEAGDQLEVDIQPLDQARYFRLRRAD